MKNTSNKTRSSGVGEEASISPELFQVSVVICLEFRPDRYLWIECTLITP